MSKPELIQVTLQFLFYALATLSLGQLVSKLIIRKRDTSIEGIGYSLLIGSGLIGYIWLALGLTGNFEKKLVTTSLILVTLLGLPSLLKATKRILISLKSEFKLLVKHPVATVFIAFASWTLLTLFLAAMLPPHASDELSYHYPEALSIVRTAKVSFPLGGHNFYGNLPTLMEVISAGGIIFSGFALAHLQHLLFLIALLLIVYGVIRRRYGVMTASLSVLGLMFLDFLTWNARVGYNDAATVILEITALLSFAEYWDKPKREGILRAAILLGLAISIKYSALITVAFIGLGYVISLWKHNYKGKKLVDKVSIFGGVIAVFGGFWYLKNSVQYGNPTYPLYFGHKGYPENEFVSLMGAIQQFGPKSLLGFLRIPGRILSLHYLPIFINWFWGLAAVVISKGRKFHLVLWTYFVAYVFYWYFIATHQVRFLIPAFVVAMILGAIFVTQLKVKQRLYVILITIFTIFLFNLQFRFYSDYYSWKGFWDRKFNMVERQYALGNETKTHFLNRNFGCQYETFTLLNEEPEVTVIDNWSVWHDSSLSFFFPDLGIARVKVTPELDIKDYLDVSNIKYIYFKTDIKKNHLKTDEIIVNEYKKGKKELEDYLLEYSNLYYSNETCRVYEIDFEELDIAPDFVWKDGVQ